MATHLHLHGLGRSYKVSLRKGLSVAALVYLVAVAYGCLNFYDKPVRECLRKKVLGSSVEAKAMEISAVAKYN